MFLLDTNIWLERLLVQRKFGSFTKRWTKADLAQDLGLLYNSLVAGNL